MIIPIFVFFCILSSFSLVSSTLPVRRNLFSLRPSQWKKFHTAVTALKNDYHLYQPPNILPPSQASNSSFTSLLSSYDYFIVSHSRYTNFAHMGPAFFPWHRLFLIKFEQLLQTISNDPSLTIPYWDWSDESSRLKLFASHLAGGSGVPSGDDQIQDGVWTNWNRMLDYDAKHQLVLINKSRIKRSFGSMLTDMPAHSNMGNLSIPPVLPQINELVDAFRYSLYDSPPYNDSSHHPPSFRNIFEGWQPTGCSLHNTVHLWIGGHMRRVAISPNDPIFWLHHSFVDKIFTMWQQYHHNNDNDKKWGFIPDSGARLGHNLNDIIQPFDKLHGHDRDWRIIDIVNPNELPYTYQDDRIDRLIRNGVFGKIQQ